MMPPDFGDMGPAAKIRALGRAELPAESIDKYPGSCVAANVIRQVADSLGSAAS